MNLDKFIGRKVIITCMGGSEESRTGVIRKGQNVSYTHYIEKNGKILLYLSDLPEHKIYTWKLLKKKLG